MRLRSLILVLAPLLVLLGCSHTADKSAINDQQKFTAQTYYAAGQIAESQHEIGRAINEYRLSLNAPGPHAPSLYRLAVLYTQRKDYPQAIEIWKQYVSATYGSALAYGDLAYACQLAGKFADATSAYDQALRKEPSNPTVRVNYGLMLAGKGNIPAAQNQLSGILTQPQVHYQIGIACQENRNYTEARNQFTQAIALDPQLFDAKVRLAELNSSASAK